MSAPVFTRRLGKAIFTGTRESQLLGTVPAGQVWVVRDVTVGNASTVPSKVQVWIAAPGAYHIVAQDLPAFTMFHLDLRQVLNSGEELHGFADTNGVSLLVTGYVFSSSP